jgi:hypothetical protein
MEFFFRDFRDGILAYGKALTPVSKLRLWGFLLLPGIISLVFGIVIIFGANMLSGHMADFLVTKYPWETGIETVRKISKGLQVCNSYTRFSFYEPII